MFVVGVYLLVCQTIARAAWHGDNGDVIMPPASGTESAPAVAMIFAPGAGLQPSSYIPLVEAMQKQVYENVKRALWVGIPKVPFGKK